MMVDKVAERNLMRRCPLAGLDFCRPCVVRRSAALRELLAIITVSSFSRLRRKPGRRARVELLRVYGHHSLKLKAFLH